MGKVNRTRIISMSLKYLRRLALNESGKYKYERELNEVLQDVFGAKNIATKLGPKSGRNKILKCIDNIDFEALVSMLADNKTSADLSLCVSFKRALDSNRYTKSESKKLKKAYKRLIDRITSSYGVKKTSYGDVLSQVDKILGDDYDDDYDDYGDYGFDDDDSIDLDDLDRVDLGSIWEDDDDGPISRTRRRYRDKRKGDGNRLAALLYGSKYGSDRDPEYDDIVADNMKKITTVLENLNDRLDRIENGSDDDDDEDDDEDFYEPPKKKSSRGGGKRAPVGSAMQRSINNDEYGSYWEGGDADGYEEGPSLPGIDPEDDEELPTEPVPTENNNEVISLIKALSIQVSGSINTLGTEIEGVKKDMMKCMTNISTIMTDIYGDDTAATTVPEPTQQQAPLVAPPGNNNGGLVRDSEVKQKTQPPGGRYA